MTTISGMAITLSRLLAATLSAGFNLVPLYGIHAWGWDAFQLLLVYWAETLILFVAALAHIACIPTPRLGTMIINGSTVAATHRMLIGFFALTAGVFMAGHLFLLCVLFSGDWFGRFRDVADFTYTFFVASAAWQPLLLAALASIIDMLIGEFHPAFVDVLARRLGVTLVRPQSGLPAEAFGSVVGGVYLRIVIMQAAVIFGAMAARRFGTMAPLVVAILLKTLIDFSSRWSAIFSSPHPASKLT